ncbi:hypothetical protein AVEN_104934-1 [Araneus ventricosus]|uniref:Secreted protein n=1 Tax=Araneus ventricosus TaxID=182803 RepID=A0A4Y2WKG8_ARAVE|nr:hypothetical protein AVEN_104934-1 [Araneus ventricosus]
MKATAIHVLFHILLFHRQAPLDMDMHQSEMAYKNAIPGLKTQNDLFTVLLYSADSLEVRIVQVAVRKIHRLTLLPEMHKLLMIPCRSVLLFFVHPMCVGSCSHWAYASQDIRSERRSTPEE